MGRKSDTMLRMKRKLAKKRKDFLLERRNVYQLLDLPILIYNCSILRISIKR